LSSLKELMVWPNRLTCPLPVAEEQEEEEHQPDPQLPKGTMAQEFIIDYFPFFSSIISSCI
jgi:hypothetical protein